MKKIAVLSALTIALTACGGQKTVYVVDSLPEDLRTTEVDTVPQTTSPRPTTTVQQYIPPSSSFSYDERLYLDGVRSLYLGYIYLTDYDLVDMAYVICDTLDSGISLESLITIIASEISSYASSDTVDFVTAIMASAIINICPRHQWQIPNY